SQASLTQQGTELEQERRRILVKFPERDDPQFIEHKNLLYTREELDKLQAYEKDHATPNIVADNYLKSLESKPGAMIRRTGYVGLFKHPQKPDSFAVCYTVTSRGTNKQLAHVYVFKDQAGYWQISTFSPDGVHVMLGSPPTGFSKVKES